MLLPQILELADVTNQTLIQERVIDFRGQVAVEGNFVNTEVQTGFALH